mmetsp:Transcript_18719/g.38307  ORF Transcript_18719/g.38307 Transcript_18719/m.38307 type:complete len:325 (+) Transcript_18719:9818-10792(+)
MPTSRVGDVATELQQGHPARAHPLSDFLDVLPALAIGDGEGSVPEAVVGASGGHIVDDPVHRVHDPIGSGGLIDGQERPYRTDDANEVADDVVSDLCAVLQEHSVASSVMHDIPVDPEVVGAVHSDRSIKRMVNRAVLDVAHGHGTNHMEVYGVLPQLQPLSRPPNLDLRQPHEHLVLFGQNVVAGIADAVREHQLAAKLLPVALVVPLNDDVPRQKPHLRANLGDVYASIVTSPALTLVGVPKGPVQLNREPVAAHAHDGQLFRLELIPACARDDDFVARLPVHRLVHCDGGVVVVCCLGQAHPVLLALTVQVENAPPHGYHL